MVPRASLAISALHFASIISCVTWRGTWRLKEIWPFPGFFRGLLDTRASHVNQAMKIAAAKAIASLVAQKELSEEYIIPSIFDTRVAPAVAAAVAKAAYQTRAARRTRRAVGQYRLT